MLSRSRIAFSKLISSVSEVLLVGMMIVVGVLGSKSLMEKYKASGRDNGDIEEHVQSDTKQSVVIHSPQLLQTAVVILTHSRPKYLQRTFESVQRIWPSSPLNGLNFSLFVSQVGFIMHRVDCCCYR